MTEECNDPRCEGFNGAMVLDKIGDAITEYGCAVIGVLGDEETPTFSYTVGLGLSYCAPELIIVGVHPRDAHMVLNNLGTYVKHSAGAPVKAGKFPAGDEHTLNGAMAVYLVPLNEGERREKMCQVYNFDPNFQQAFQIVIPDREGLLPWEEGCQEAFAKQPLPAAAFEEFGDQLRAAGNLKPWLVTQ